MQHPVLYRLLTKFAPLGSLLHPLVQNTALDPVRAWTATRDFPEAPPNSFRALFKAHKAGKSGASNHSNTSNGGAR
jgi:hypothetical protein